MFSAFKNQFVHGASVIFRAKDERRKKRCPESTDTYDSGRLQTNTLSKSSAEPESISSTNASAESASNTCPLKPSHAATQKSLSSILISKENIRLCDVVGSGQFGDVFRGVFEETSVAIKVSACDDLRSTMTEQVEIMQKLVREAEAMSRLNHNHIIKLLGVCCSEPVWLVMEFAPLGQLRSFLRSHKNNFDRKLLFSYSVQISDALVYLAELRILHRDIAARNVLVADENLVKLADFGLSRCLIDESSYYKMSSGKLPVKWLAPESICYRRFTHASDVWMFAVCMWEIFKLGEKPFVNTKNADVLSLLERGERLAKPEICPLRIYNLWTLCWSYEPSRRPKIKKVKEILENIYADEFASGTRADGKLPKTTPNTRIANAVCEKGRDWKAVPEEFSSHRGRLIPLPYDSATLQPTSNVLHPSRTDGKLSLREGLVAFKRRTLTLEEIKSYERQKKLFQELSSQLRQQLFDQTLYEQKLQAEEDDEWLDEQQRRFLCASDADDAEYSNNSRQQLRTQSPSTGYLTLSVADRKRSQILSHLLNDSEARQAQITITAQKVADLSRSIIRLTNDICCGVNYEELAENHAAGDDEVESPATTFSIVNNLGLSITSLSAHIDTLLGHISSATTSRLDTVPIITKKTNLPNFLSEFDDNAKSIVPQLLTQLQDTRANLTASMKLVVEAATLAGAINNPALVDAEESDADASTRYYDSLATAVRLVAVDTRRLLHLIVKKNRLVDLSN